MSTLYETLHQILLMVIEIMSGYNRDKADFTLGMLLKEVTMHNETFGVTL